MLVQPPAQSSPPNPVPRPQYRVSTKTAWAGNWAVVKYLQALHATVCAAPSCPKASFRWLAGNIKWEDQNALAAQPVRSDLLDAFVLIEGIPAAGGAPFPIWAGRFYEEANKFHGAAAAGMADQDPVAYGLQHELDRETLRGAWITNDGATAVRIDANLSFNEKFVQGFREVGNRSAAKVTVNGQQTYVFSNALDANGNSYPWSVLDIVNYLLACYGPAGIPFTVGGQTDALASTILPRIAIHHQSVFQLLNEIIDRRQGLCWCIRTTGTGNVELHVTTVFDKPVTFDNATLKANTEQASIDLTKFPTSYASEVRVDIHSLDRYGTIIVAGEPILSCFTVSFADGTLTEGWTAAKETAYAAANGQTTPKDADRERASPRFSQVYTTFKIPATWNWMAGGGEGTFGLEPANPQFSVAGRLMNAAVNAPTRTWGQTLLRSLPIPKDEANLANPDGLEPEYMEPLVFLYNETDQKFVFAHDPGGPPGANANAHVRMLDHDFGFEVKFRPSHLLALNHFTTAANGGSAAPSDPPDPQYDYKKLVATVAARSDQRLQAVVTIPNEDPNRVLQIYVEDAEVWYLCPNTVTDVQNGALIRNPVGGVTRDDSGRIRQIAALAQAWFGTVRGNLDLTVNDLWTQYAVGSLILTLTDFSARANINSVVSEILYDFDAMTTNIRTNYGELDFKAAGGHAQHATIH